MRRVARPTAGLVEHFAEHHIGIGRGLIVKHREHLAVGGAVPLRFAEFLEHTVRRRIPNKAEVVIIIGLLN